MGNYKNNGNILTNPTPEDVFCDCYNQYWQAIYSYLQERTKDSHLALDLTQNAFLKFWTLRDQYYSIGNKKAFLMQMAKNALLDSCRQAKNHVAYIDAVSYGIEVSKNLTETNLEEREVEKRFQQAILDLSGRRRAVFVLSKFEGWRREEIANALGISPFTVKVTLQKAIREVRKKCTTAHQFSTKQKK